MQRYRPRVPIKAITKTVARTTDSIGDAGLILLAMAIAILAGVAGHVVFSAVERPARPAVV